MHPTMRLLISFFLTLAASLALAANTPDKAAFAIDCAFPGGNILVSKIEGETVTLGPDRRDSIQHWFYWYYRVTGAGGRKLTFVFTKNNVGARGPGVSVDGGKTWKWLGADAVVDGTFSFAFPAGADEVRFSVGMPYVRADLDRFLAGHKDNPFLQLDALAKTRKGRDVPLLRIGDPKKKARYAVAFTCRHHCCEMMASYLVEGIVEGALADDAAGRWLRGNADFFIAPIMDTDGVEDGDQGKNRGPRDHNRDYATTPLYPEVAALKEELPVWAAGRPLIFLDLHDPALRTDIHETVHFLEPEQRDQAARMDRLCTYLQRDQQGPILYRKASNLRFGSGYNTHVEQPSPLSAGWARSLPNTLLGCTIETAYANAGGCEVNAHSGRELGRDLIVALKEFLRNSPEEPTNK